MATAFDNLAPRVIADLMTELGLTAAQAAGIVGNLGAESGLLAIQEKRPLSGRGGFGWAQWTNTRRVAFERWCAEKGLDKESYDANLGFLVQELRTTHKASLQQLKKTTTVKAAAETFGYWFERFAGFEKLNSANYKQRIALAERAMQLYQSKEPVMPIPPAPPVTPAVPPAVPWYKSQVLWGIIISALGKATAILFPKFSWTDEQTTQLVEVITLAASFIGDAIAAHGRISATAQPVTFTQSGADSIAITKGLPTEAQSDATAADDAEPFVIPAQPIPLEQMPLAQLVEELPRVLSLFATVIPAVGALSRIIEAVDSAGGGKGLLAPPSSPSEPSPK